MPGARYPNMMGLGCLTGQPRLGTGQLHAAEAVAARRTDRDDGRNAIRFRAGEGVTRAQRRLAKTSSLSRNSVSSLAPETPNTPESVRVIPTRPV